MANEHELTPAARLAMLKDMIFNMSPQIIAGLIGLATVAAQIHNLDPEAYGLWISVNALIETTTMVDLGIGWRIARAVGADPMVERAETRETLGICAVSLGVLAVLGGAATFLLSVLTAGAFDLSHEIAPLAVPAALCGAVIHAATMLTVYFQSVLFGCRRFDLVGLFSGLQVTGIGLTTIAASVMDLGILGIGLAHAAVVLVICISGTLTLQSLMPRHRITFSISNWRFRQTFDRFGISSQMSDLANTATWEFAPIVIGAIGGAAMVVPFHVGLRIPKKLAFIMISAGEVLMPVGAGHSDEAGGPTALAFMVQAIRWNLLKLLPIVVTLAVIGPTFLTVWLHRVDPVALDVLRLTAIAVIFDTAGNGVLYFLWGRRRMRQVLIAGFTKAVTALGLTAALVTNYGAAGAAAAFCVGFFVAAAYLIAQAPRGQANEPGALIAILRGFSMPIAADIFATAAVMHIFPAPDLLQLFLGSLCGGAAFAIAYVVQPRHAVERAMVINAAGKLGGTALALFRPGSRP